jgi:DNA processing protein
VVVEAGRRSGTLSTASAAATLGRVLMAVPGPVTSALSVGCHMLLSTGVAVLVTSAEDVLAELGEGNGVVGIPEPPVKASPSPEHPTDGLDSEAARIYEAFPFRGVVTVTELSSESALPAARVIAGLAVLELQQLVKRQDGAWRRWRKSDG